MLRKLTIIIIAFAFILSLLAAYTAAATSVVVTFPAKDVKGEGPLPYNYRIIDENIHAGGHPLNPSKLLFNSDKQVKSILDYLRSKGINTFVDLENTGWIQGRYKSLLKEAGIKRIHIPMHSSRVPTEDEWEAIKEAMEKPVYIHCKWGADRTGAIIARYLMEEKNYGPKKAWLAVISGGTHAGPIGGLKKKKDYRKLVLFFWPDAEEDKDFEEAY